VVVRKEDRPCIEVSDPCQIETISLPA
jgi:hypothetical protein